MSGKIWFIDFKKGRGRYILPLTQENLDRIRRRATDGIDQGHQGKIVPITIRTKVGRGQDVKKEEDRPAHERTVPPEKLEELRAKAQPFRRTWVYKASGHGRLIYWTGIGPPRFIDEGGRRYALAGYVNLEDGTIYKARAMEKWEMTWPYTRPSGKSGYTHLGYAKPDDPIYRLGPVVAGRPIFAGPPKKKGGQK